MNKLKIIYWIVTIIFAVLIVYSAIPDILSTPTAIEFMRDILGYPLYLLPFIGVAKILGAIFILYTRFPRLTEWAYAGLFFDLIGATYSILAIGTPILQASGMLMFIIPAVASYLLYRKVKPTTI